MQRFIDAGQVPGTITAIMRRGRLVHFEARGWLDAEAQVPMPEDALFRIASMTKPITSVALMMLWSARNTDPVPTARCPGSIPNRN